ncbi:hypothetical protein RB213_008208 [Colletotrichum asianum]
MTNSQPKQSRGKKPCQVTPTLYGYGCSSCLAAITLNHHHQHSTPCKLPGLVVPARSPARCYLPCHYRASVNTRLDQRLSMDLCSRHFLPCPPLPGAQGTPSSSISVGAAARPRTSTQTNLSNQTRFFLSSLSFHCLTPASPFTSSYTRPAPRSSHSTWFRSSKRPPSYSVPCCVIARRMGPDRSSCISHMYAARSTQHVGIGYGFLLTDIQVCEQLNFTGIETSQRQRGRR